MFDVKLISSMTNESHFAFIWKAMRQRARLKKNWNLSSQKSFNFNERREVHHMTISLHCFTRLDDCKWEHNRNCEAVTILVYSPRNETKRNTWFINASNFLRVYQNQSFTDDVSAPVSQLLMFEVRMRNSLTSKWHVWASRSITSGDRLFPYWLTGRQAGRHTNIQTDLAMSSQQRPAASEVTGIHTCIVSAVFDERCMQ